ncbi:hypothetical protein [Undibacterium sp. TJN19]|uniref:hypothetical protein n=1 Tax=Undibacterium sp. TJN19 TaxID=3413055 RepID=UPI003BF40C0B
MKYKKTVILLTIALIFLGGAGYFLFKHKAVDNAKPEVFNADTAMLAIFGTYNDQHKGVLLPEQTTQNWDVAQADTMATALFTATYTEAGRKMAVLALQRQQMFEGVVEESHATAAVISVYVFAFNGQQWVFEKGKKEVTEAGAHGNAPGGKLIRLGQDRYGLLFKGGDIHQGYTNDYAFVISLSDPKPAKVLELDMGESNSGTCSEDQKEQEESGLQACWERVAKLSFLQQNPADAYFVLQLTTTSNEKTSDQPDSSKVEKTGDKYFVRTANGYKLSRDPGLKSASIVSDELVNNAGETVFHKTGAASSAKKEGK